MLVFVVLSCLLACWAMFLVGWFWMVLACWAFVRGCWFGAWYCGGGCGYCVLVLFADYMFLITCDLVAVVGLISW